MYMSDKPDFLNNYVNSNGVKLDYLLFTEEDDIYIPFKYKLFKTKDVDVLTNYNEFIKNYYSTNIIIDYRMILTITYLVSDFNDILIYDIYTNKIITFNYYVVKKIFSGHSKLFDTTEIINLMYLNVFIRYFCSKINLRWIPNLAIQCVKGKKYLKNAININSIIQYLNNSNINKLKLTNEYENIPKKIKIKDGISEFQSKNIDNIINELNMLSKNSEFILRF